MKSAAEKIGKIILFLLLTTACNPQMRFANTNPNYKSQEPAQPDAVQTPAAVQSNAVQPTVQQQPAPQQSIAPKIETAPQPRIAMVEPKKITNDTDDIEKTIAAVEPKVSFKPEAFIPSEQPKEVTAPKEEPKAIPELEKEVAEMNNSPEPVETIDVDKFVAMTEPEVSHKEKTKAKSVDVDKTNLKEVATRKIKPKPVPKAISEPQARLEREVQEPGMDSDTEIFEHKPSKVDILFVVDNSPSMLKEQKKLGERLHAFMRGIRNMDWQIAFTTTDVTSRKYGLKGSLLDLAGHPNEKILTNNFRDAEDVFFNTVQRPDGSHCFIVGCPSSNEQPLKASILAMQKANGENAGFFRDDADLSIVILSDEDEMSTGSPRATKPYQVVDAFHSIFGDSKKLSVYGIIIEPNDGACYDDQKSESFADAFPGNSVTELSKMTEGITGSICENDYSVALEKIGESTRIASDYYILKREPVANSVKVKLIPEQSVQWKIEKNHLQFVSPPKDGTIVQVSYDYSSSLK